MKLSESLFAICFFPFTGRAIRRSDRSDVFNPSPFSPATWVGSLSSLAVFPHCLIASGDRKDETGRDRAGRQRHKKGLNPHHVNNVNKIGLASFVTETLKKKTLLLLLIILNKRYFYNIYTRM